MVSDSQVTPLRGYFRIAGFMPACASELILADFKTDLILPTVPYAALLPGGNKDGAQMRDKRLQAGIELGERPAMQIYLKLDV